MDICIGVFVYNALTFYLISRGHVGRNRLLGSKISFCNLLLNATSCVKIASEILPLSLKECTSSYNVKSNSLHSL